MLAALQACYSDVRECVKTADGLTDDFPSGVGAKQGCPSSPALFDLYIDTLEDFICANVTNGGTVKLHGTPVPVFFF